MPRHQRLYYTGVDGATRERAVMPMRVIWHQHAELPAPEWFLHAYDCEAASDCLLRLAGCDFSAFTGDLKR